MAYNEARKPIKCPNCERRFTPVEAEIDGLLDDHLRDDHNINLAPENFFYLNEAESSRSTSG